MKKMKKINKFSVTPKIIEEILSDPKVMVEITKENFFLFFYVFFGNYIKCKIAPFHRKMFRYADDESNKRILVISFRNSAKSSIYNTALSLWSIMGKLQNKYVVIASYNQQRARDCSNNIAAEVEKNSLLRQYLGPFEEKTDQWSRLTRVIPRYNARITFVSVGEGIRSLREGPNRPQLIIIDDIDSYDSTATKENRDKTFKWLTGELIPAGDVNTRVIFIGNFIHQDSALMRIMQLMQEGKMKGKFLKVPLVDENNKIAWPGMFRNMQAIEEFRKSIGNEFTWQLEYLLKSIPTDQQIIQEEWFKYYDALPHLSGEDYKGTYISIDPASGNDDDGSCFTAMVMASVFGKGDNLKIFIHPNPINKKLTLYQAREQAVILSKMFGSSRCPTFIVEYAACQVWLYQELKRKGLWVEKFNVSGVKKEDRLRAATLVLETGKVFFHKEGNKDLINQLINFGSETYKDLADAFSALILTIMEKDRLSGIIYKAEWI